MSKLTVVVFSLLGLISACVGQGVVQTGQCQTNIAVVTNFVAADYAGVWYDIESLPSDFQSGTCNTATYTVTTNGLNIENSQVNAEGFRAVATGTATAVAGEPLGTAKFNVQIGNSATPAPYWILDTDYVNFALVYSCVNVDANNRRVNSWKLGREKGPLPAESAARINARIAAEPVLSAVANSYIPRDHSALACSYFVEIEGTCSTTITGDVNFNASIFQGRWYESARYRQEFQTGQCNRAEYAADANGIVSVQNSQVNGQALQTRSGVAFEVTGRPGVLQVNFNVNGELRSQNLVVLATDNTNYALLYSCTQVAVNRRRISSWQLRKRLAPLDEIHTTAINNAITANADLQQAPYVETSQTYASCFYYPEWATLPATIDLPGPCDQTITGAANFNAQNFLGTWYEVARFPSPTQAGQCNRAQYGLTNGVITVRNSQVTNELLSTILGTATPVTGQPGVLDVTLSTSSGDVTQRLYVLATDNNNYALLYSCQNIVEEGVETRRRVNSWKLSKQLGVLSADANAAIDSAIEATEGLRQNYYLPTTSQTDAACFHYPVWDTLPATIDLPGPCNSSITGVVGFDTSRFLGTWYEVARYPQPTQAGQCNRATYGPITGGVVTVQNSQVTSEALYTISGQATAVTGQPGVLDVTLITSSGPVTRRLIVLATDYDNYALLYSCTTIQVGDETQRRVGSWQLTKHLGPLNAESSVAINTKIAATQGLRQNYYQTTSQSESSCFYYPEWATLPATIDLPGPCDQTITGAANFNAQTFLGTWYEVARFPSPTQAGQCNRAQYGLTNGVITVRNSQVTNELLSTILGTATPVTGQPGVLDVTLSTSSGDVTQRLYVLATDNNNYALLYSCQNIVEEGVETRRRVNSWKLSKQLGVLSADANAAIDSAIEATQGLRQNYYLPTTSQTDAACFHYPVWDTLPATIDLPGPCNSSITGVVGFDTSRFLGTWYEVARYPQPTQAGQCNRATYGPITGGVVTVQNSQVTSEALYTISGQATAVTGQPGVLDVTLITSSGPVTQRLIVLATDYDNYALLYSCTTIQVGDETQRRVGSWQLTKHLGPLNAESISVAINTTIAATQGLRQNYYQTTSQSDSSCFYYPEWETLPATIELPGPCNTTITGATAFNAQTFTGTWYEIERYPQPTQAGQCNRAEYGITGAVINVQNSQVTDQTLSTIPGTATAVAGQTGVLDVTLTTSSGPVTQRLYVLATDNTNYALLYSCQNIEGNRRQVGSWRLSKQLGPLSETANATIDTVIANTQGLRRNYYQTTRQDAGACFHYPATQAGEKVVIPGQCDAALLGQANINMTRFANGTWYHIQRYDQVGNRSCIATRLSYETSDEGNSVIVNSIELVGDVENRTRGTAQLVAAASGQFSLTWSGSEDSTTITVVRTDYDTYAIAYTCENSGTNRQVGVWLLSRGRAWPAAGVTELATLVQNREEFTLRDGYFKVIPHNDDCPEPSSAFLFKSSIIVIFVCTVLQFVW